MDFFDSFPLEKNSKKYNSVFRSWYFDYKKEGRYVAKKANVERQIKKAFS